MLAARFLRPLPVGMMLANIPALLVGDGLADRVPVKWIRLVAAIVFAGLAAFSLLAPSR
jgi:putative Ca2+/H+ antiporter (TMEM165/GDT1 family)